MNMRWSVMCLVMAMACTEYGVNNKIQLPPEPDELAGEIQVDPDSVTVVGCGDVSVEVTLSNVGEGDLAVTGLAVEGDGAWILQLPTLPFVLEPGGQQRLDLLGQGGSADLVVISDDPAQERVVVPLVVSADAGPTVEILSPSHGDIIDIGAGLVLESLSSDDVDSAEDLQLSWESSLDGLVGNPVADASGVAEWSWASVDRTSGPHQLTFAARDSCGNVSSADINVCQQAGYTTDEYDISSWHFEGSANWDSTNEWLQLTPVANNVVGSAFQTANPVNGDAVSIQFAFYIGGGSGADGLSLTALDTSRMSGFLGGTGCGIGYGGDASCTGGPALPGWSIEIDTYHNDDVDPTDGDHLTFTFDGDLDAPVAWAELPEMEDTGWHTMEVNVVAPRVTIAVDGVVYTDADLSGHFAFPAYVGFTAGTGGANNEHLVDALEVVSTICE